VVVVVIGIIVMGFVIMIGAILVMMGRAIAWMLACNASRLMHCSGSARDRGGRGVALVGAVGDVDNVCLVVIGLQSIRF